MERRRGNSGLKEKECAHDINVCLLELFGVRIE
jgi:hypothetical protein